ncbi:gliding motility-associated C-terminal domain-containing protein [Maribacter sp. IgM3_T14_3]|uniref:Ig-like domain-containing protein n=1 Tax=Maribacter sp. IgM3_T14_3 TaxID=3415140 RepID=UPI003C6F13B5
MSFNLKIGIVSKWILICTTLFLYIGVSAQADCPTIGSATQDFCAIDNPTVADLSLRATDTGSGIQWYNVVGTALSDSSPLEDNTIYFLDNDNSSCTSRTQVTVNIFGNPPGNVPFEVGRCSSSENTLAQLTADGTNIEWYDAANNGNFLPLSTPLVNGTTYYVQQTENGCTSIRLGTRINITDPNPPTVDLEQFFCIDPSNTVTYTIADLMPNGADIKWYNSQASTVALPPSTVLVENATYYATQTTNTCESTNRSPSTVRFENVANPGQNGVMDICDSATVTINLINQLVGAPDAGGIWSGPASLTITGGDQGTFDTTQLDSGVYTFTYTIPAQNACPADSATVRINVQEEPDAGEDNVLEICTNEPTVNLFTLLGGTPDTGGTWSPAMTSGTGLFDPSVDSSGVYTYTANPTAPCSIADTATITVSVEQAPNAGNNADLDICEQGTPVDLFTLLGSNAMAGGTWSPVLTSGTGFFDPTVDNAGNYTYSLPASSTCLGDDAIVTVTIDPQLSAGTGGNILFCTNDSSLNLFTLLTNDPDTGGTWSPSLASGTGVFNPSVDSAGSYTYTVGNGGTCPLNTATISVTVDTAPNAGSNATFNFCGDSPETDLFSLLGPNADTGGTWNGPTALGNGDAGTFDPATNAAGLYVYTVGGTGACEDVNTIVTVTVADLLPTIDINGNEFCIMDNPTVSDLLARIIPENNGTLTVYDSEMGTNTLVNSDVLLDDTSYFISETDTTSGCEGTRRLEIVVSINNPETPTLSDAVGEFCLINSPIISDLNEFLIVGTNVIWVDALTNVDFVDSDILITGDYYAVEEDVFGCRSMPSSTIAIQINDNPPPILITDGNEFCGADDPTIADLEVNLTVDAGLAVVWYDAQENGNLIATTELLINGGIYYAASFNSVTGCESNVRIEIITDLTICDPELYPLLIPDGFSPNGDGINDTFSLIDVEFIYEDYTIEIYNRYGNLVFTGNKDSANWDGTSNQASAIGSNLMPNGVYFYIFNYNKNNIAPTQGRIYLNR